MKHLLALLAICTPTAVICCFHDAPLTAVANKIPEKIQCDPITTTDAVEWLTRYEKPENRTSVEEELKKLADTHPIRVVCLLLEGERLVRERGDRKSEIYLAILQGLKDLKVFE